MFHEEMMNDHDDVEQSGQGEEDGKHTEDNYRLVSKPIKSERCTIDENVIQFHHSFGYDCRSKMFNICAADDHTVVYAAGGYIGMFDVNDGSSSFRKCAGNGCIGHIAKNPVFGHLAVGENGCGGDDDSAMIIVYEWPTFEIVSVLRGSAKKQNKWLTYNQNGRLLCSQAGEPDYTLTIWDWEKSLVVLRTKSHSRDVYVCRFSAFMDDHLVTAGSGHVKFWKMAKTFTGLKLKGRLGRFGKTNISDVIGIFSMPDEKDISGCDWGNILVWDEDVVHVQVMRKGRNPCHLAPIIMFLYSERDMELTSVSMDGTIKFWYYRTMDTADPAGGGGGDDDDDYDGRVIETEPSFTITVQDSIGVAKIMGMCKVDNDRSSNDHFIQDGNGGIWLADIEVSANAKPLRRLAKFHGDVITSLLTSPVGYFIATTSLDGWFHVYDVARRHLMFTHNFNVPITSSIWLPLNVASSGNVFVIGFQTGILKMVAAPLKEVIKKKTLLKIIGIQSSKPHTDSIRHLTVNRNATVLVCGSDDCSIFVYKINTDPIKLNPIGMYSLPGKVTFIHWKPSEKQTALISCASGHIVEVNVPTSRPLYTKESFLLKLESRVIKTVSIRYQIFREQHKLDVERRKEEEKINRKKKRLEINKGKNPYSEIVEDLFVKDLFVEDLFVEDASVEDCSEDKEPPEIDMPSTPNPVLFAIYTPSERTLWVSVDGYDAGLLYEYDFDSPEPINATMIPDKNNTSLTTIKIFETDPLTVLMGFDDGRIRVTNVKAENLYDLNDYIEYAVHDNKTGRVQMLCLSYDDRMLFTYGDDGNIFSFTFRCDNDVVDKCMNSIADLPQSSKFAEEDIIKAKEELKISLEERKIDKKMRKALQLAIEEKDKTRCLINELKERFKQVLLDNESLPEPLRFSHDYFHFDERINRSLVEEAQSKMNKLHMKLAFDYEKSLLGLRKVKKYFVDKIITAKFKVKAISEDTVGETIYHEVHNNIFEIPLKEFLSRKHPNNLQRRTTYVETMSENPVHKITESEIFLRNIREIYPTLPKKIQCSIDKFAARIEFENQEILKIKNIQNEKPNHNIIEENNVLNDSRETIGNLNLKTATDFKLSDNLIISLEDKFEQYMFVRKEIYDLKSNFNKKVFNIKQRRIQMKYDYRQFKFDIDMIRNELNDSEITPPANLPEVLINESNDLNLLDKFEPSNRQYSDPMYMSLNNLYNVEMFKNELYEEQPTNMEIAMQQLIRPQLKYRHECLYESMITKINLFDDYILALDAERKDVKIRIKFLELFALSLEEEIIILNEFDLLEDEYLHTVHNKTITQNEKVNQIMTNQKDIANYIKTIDINSNKLIDIQHTFDMEVRNNSYAKQLKYIFKKKIKTPKVKSIDDGDNDSFSSFSSDESDELESESDENTRRDSLTTMNRFTVFDENVLPVGCDPKLFALTFELRSQRHTIEQSIENNKKAVELLNKTLNLAYVELDVIENDLKENLKELEAYRIKKQLRLNKVEVTSILNKSQICKNQLWNGTVLVIGNVTQDLANRVTELKKETESIKLEYKNETLNAKQLRTEINAMEQILKSYKVAIKDEMMKKLKIETDWSFLDDMEMTIINYMIIQAKSRTKETKEHFITEIKLLEKQIRANQDVLTELIEANTIKTLALKSVFESIRQLQQDLSVQPKNYERFQVLSANNMKKDDIVALKTVYDKLTKRKRDICVEINALKSKGKMFPPIAMRRSQPTTTSQDEKTACCLSRSLSSTLEEDEEEEKEEEEGSSCSTTNVGGENEERRQYEIEFNVEPKATTVSRRSSSGQWSSWVGSGEEKEGDDGWGKYDDDDEETAAVGLDKADATSEGTRNEDGFDEGGSSEDDDYAEQSREDGSSELSSPTGEDENSIAGSI